MEQVILNTKKKLVYLKSYDNLIDIKNAIKTIQESPNEFQISVLKKISDESNHKNSILDKKIIQPKFWTAILENKFEHGIFDSPEMGKIFIIGSLTSLFLHKVDDRVLGEMTTGIYGILRGVGFCKNTVEIFMQNLNLLNFLLIIRGENDQLKDVQELLEF